MKWYENKQLGNEKHLKEIRNQNVYSHLNERQKKLCKHEEKKKSALELEFRILKGMYMTYKHKQSFFFGRQKGF